MKTQKPEQDCWSLIFELWVKMSMTEKWELHCVNKNAVKGKNNLWKTLIRKQIQKNQAKFREQLNKKNKMETSI